MHRPALLSSLLSMLLLVGGCGDEKPNSFGVGGTGGTPALCAAGETLCGETCVSLLTSASNCGACGTQCSPGKVCQGGTCQCQTGYAPCGTSCVNLQGDGSHCGACGTVCPAGQVCSAGLCGATCTVVGETVCGNSCVTLSLDSANCGSCGVACPVGQVCQGGCKCPQGEQLCDPGCVNTASSPFHCGACGQACAPGQSCVGGVCLGGGTGGGGGDTGGGGASTGGVSTGGVSTGGVSTGGVSTGGVSTGGVSTGGTGGTSCTNTRPTGTQWDAATCDMWAAQTSECSAAWMIENDYCNESCGRCSTASGGTGGGGSGGTSTGGAATGGTPSGGTGGSGGGVTFDCGDIPAAGAGNVARPSGSPGNLRVINWAGFKGAVTFSFDDNTSSTIAAYDQLAATGVRMTFYLWTGQSSFSNPVYGRARDAGSELGNHTSDHVQGSVSVNGMNTGKADIERQWGVTPYTFAAPYGVDYSSAVQGKYLLSRDAGGVTPILPNGNDNLGKLAACLPQNSAEVTTRITQARNAGGWMFFCIHGFSSSDGSYLPLDLNGFISAVNSAKQLGDMWLDTAENIGAYYVGQRLVSRATPSGRTWSWALPGGFPPNKCLRVTVDGGTVTQGGQAVAWDPHGYYEISLDAGSVTVDP